VPVDPNRNTATDQSEADRMAERLVAYWNRSTTAVAAETGSVLPEYEYEPPSAADSTGEVEESFGWMLAAVSDEAANPTDSDDETWEN
jgi:hypothetical protein